MLEGCIACFCAWSNCRCRCLIGGARPMPRRWARGRARRPSHLRRPRRHLGQPEMKLGVFAPAASCLLPELIGPAAFARSAAVRPQHHRRASGGHRHRVRSRRSIRNAPRSLISKNISSRKARARSATPSRRRGSTTSRASRTRSAPSSGFISTNSWPPTTRWPVSKPLSRRGRRYGNIVERYRRQPTSSHAPTRCSRISSLARRAQMESRQARPQGDRLHADLRAARDSSTPPICCRSALSAAAISSRSSTATPTTRATSAASRARPSSSACPAGSISSTACCSRRSAM